MLIQNVFGFYLWLEEKIIYIFSILIYMSITTFNDIIQMWLQGHGFF